MADNKVDYKKMESKDYTTVNFDTAYALTEELTKTQSEFEGSIQKATTFPTFTVLQSLDLCGDFPSKFDQAMEKLSTNIKDVVKSANDYFDNLKKTDEDIEGLVPKKKEKDTEGSGKRQPTGGGSKKPPTGGSENPTENPSSGSTEPVTETSTQPDNSEDQIASFKTMSMSDMSEVLSTLVTLATANNTTIDQLLSNSAFKDKIKEALLKNVNISTDLKKLIEAGSSDAMIIALKKLVSGEINEAIGMDQDTSEVIRVYLESIASKNNTTIDKLISDSTYKETVKKSLAAMKKVTETTAKFTEANVQTKLLDIYDGVDTEIDDNSMEIVRDQIDVISQLTEIPYNELLEENAYAGEMLKAANRLSRTAIYAEALSNCSADTISKVLSKIIK